MIGSQTLLKFRYSRDKENFNFIKILLHSLPVEYNELVDEKAVQVESDELINQTPIFSLGSSRDKIYIYYSIFIFL